MFNKENDVDNEGEFVEDNLFDDGQFEDVFKDADELGIEK